MKILVFLIIFVFALSLFRMILEWSKNNNSSVESVDAVVSEKIGEIYQQQIPNAGDPTGSHGFTVHDIPSFKIKFRMTDYTEKEFDVDKKAFKNIKRRFRSADLSWKQIFGIHKRLIICLQMFSPVL